LAAANRQDALPHVAAIEPYPVSKLDNPGDEKSSRDLSDLPDAWPEAGSVEPLIGRLLLESKQRGAQRPSRVIIKKGETISSIALQWNPEDPRAGIRAILQANPAIVDSNSIRAGQVLKLTEVVP
jgi:hypothetical protein